MMKQSFLLLAVAAAALVLTAEAASPCDGGFNIESFGAVAGVDTYAQAKTNGEALAKAVSQANASSTRSVLVPGGKSFSFLPAVETFDSLMHVTICLDGNLLLYTTNFTSLYPKSPSGSPYHALSFTTSEGLSVIGNGTLDGRGSEWWWYTILVGSQRPHLLESSGSRNLYVEGVTLHNSPCYHANLRDVVGLTVRKVTVLVDLNSQLEISRYIGGADEHASIHETLQGLEAARENPKTASHSARRVPAHVQALDWAKPEWAINPPFPMVYALNTDGIDFSGSNITIEGCSVTNFDDTVCAKPIFPEASRFGTPCTSNARILDTSVTYGVGISMGSVPPDVSSSPRGNCIDGIDIIGATFNEPLKAVYIKPNPAKSGPARGTIANVAYHNLTVNSPIWWAIWIGTQQQHQPHGANTGCGFLYPLFNTSCPTDPEVTLANITLSGVTVNSPLLSPGVIRANATNPGRGFVFNDVVVNGAKTWPAPNYICDDVQGVATGTTDPVPPCFRKG